MTQLLECLQSIISNSQTCRCAKTWRNQMNMYSTWRLKMLSFLQSTSNSSSKKRCHHLRFSKFSKELRWSMLTRSCKKETHYLKISSSHRSWGTHHVCQPLRLSLYKPCPARTSTSTSFRTIRSLSQRQCLMDLVRRIWFALCNRRSTVHVL